MALPAIIAAVASRVGAGVAGVGTRLAGAGARLAGASAKISKAKQTTNAIKNGTYGRQTFDLYGKAQKSPAQVREERRNIKQAGKNFRQAGKKSNSLQTGLRKIARWFNSNNGKPEDTAWDDKAKRRDLVKRVANAYTGKAPSTRQGVESLLNGIQAEKDRRQDQRDIDAYMQNVLEDAHIAQKKFEEAQANPPLPHSKEFIDLVRQGKIKNVTMADINGYQAPEPNVEDLVFSLATMDREFEDTLAGIAEEARRAESKNKVTRIQRRVGSISRSAQAMFYAATKPIWNKPGIDPSKRDEAIMDAFGVDTIEEAMHIVFSDIAAMTGNTLNDLMQPFAEIEYMEQVIQALNAHYSRL